MSWPPQLKNPHERPILSQMEKHFGQDRTAFRARLVQRFGDRAIVNPHHLIAYSYDATSERQRPDAVVLARNASDVQDAVTMAHQFDVPIIGRGSGSNISGGTIPIFGGLVIALAGLKAIRHTDWQRRLVTAEPGVINAELQNHLGTHRCFFPPDPASHRISSVGGNVAEASGGPHCVKYGVTPHYVRSLKGVLADGQSVEFPHAGDVIDWNGLLTGSEGTLALLTEMTFSFMPLPESTRTLLAGFLDLTTAVSAVSAIIAAQVVPSTLELLDRATLDAVRPFIDAGYPDTLDAVLLIELDGPDDQLNRQLARLRTVLSEHQVSYLDEADTVAKAEQLMAARRASYGAVARLGSHIWVQDVTVPRPRLAEMMEYVLTIRDQYGLAMASLAHVGDGNLHPLIPYDADDPKAIKRMLEADQKILEKAAALGGSITGEHGIGIDKLERLPLMYSQQELSAMAEVKAAFDPKGLLNPGKAVWPHIIAEAPSSLDSLDDFQQAVAHARRVAQPLIVQGRQIRHPRPSSTGTILDMVRYRKIVALDVENLTVEVESGIRLDELEAILHPHGLFFPGVGTMPQETVGGLLASGGIPFRSFSFGPLKNWVLGVTVVDGRGRRLQFGRPVVKNVAGLDMGKLFIGSLGAFGIITSAILRLWPLAPESIYGILPTTDLSLESIANLGHSLAMANHRPTAFFVVKPHKDLAQIHVLIEDWDANTTKSQVEEGTSEATSSQWKWFEGDDITSITQNLAEQRQSAWALGQESSQGITLMTHPEVDQSLPVNVSNAWIWHPTLGTAIITGEPVFANAGSLRARIYTPGHGWHVSPHTTSSGLQSIRQRLKHTFDPDNILGQDWGHSIWD